MLQLHKRAVSRLPSQYICSACRLRPQDRTLPPWQQQQQQLQQCSRNPSSLRMGYATRAHKKHATDKPSTEADPSPTTETDGNANGENTPTDGDANANANPNRTPRLPRRRRAGSAHKATGSQGGIKGQERPNKRKDQAKSEAKAKKPLAEQGASPEVIHQMFDTLKLLEQSYSSISERLDVIHSAQGEKKEPGDGKTDTSTPAADDNWSPALKKQTRKLETRMKMVSGTLDVLKNVLTSQQIPLEGLKKRSSQRKAASEQDEATTVAPSKSTSEDGLSPKFASVASSKKQPIRRPKQQTPSPEDGSAPPTSPRSEEHPTHPQLSTLAARLTRRQPPASSSTKIPALRAQTPSSAPATQTSAKHPPRLSSKRNSTLKVHTVKANGLQLVPVERPDGPPTPKLAHGLDRVLFNSGVYQLQDPRTRVYNFDPYLSKIMPLTEFDFGALKEYVTSSKDTTLFDLASKLEKKYSGSTSSMTSMLSHFHYLLSAWRPINPSQLSRSFEPEYSTYTAMLRAPAATFLHYKDGVYAIDADKEFDSANILSMLGKSMEKLLTLPKEEFERYRHQNSAQITEEERNAEEAFHFSTLGDFLMRSQLDAYDKRLPGTGMFDLKTRAVVSIRMDARGFEKGLGYEIRRRFGQWESFEREYYDMIRAAFLKYSLQVRMGRMDGIFVAFHNTQRIFGFQYIPLEEMDNSIHGAQNKIIGDHEFRLSLHLLNKAFDRATEKFPGRTLRFHVETRPGDPPFMYIFAKPVEKEEVASIQNANKEAVAEFERQLMGLKPKQADIETSEVESEQPQQQQHQPSSEEEVVVGTTETRQQTFAIWEEMQDKVDEAVEDDALGVSHVREAIQDALEQSGLLKARSPEDAQSYVEALLDSLTRGETSEDVSDVKAAINESSSEVTEVAQGVNASAPEESGLSAETTSRSRERSLKELILQVAERVDEKPETDGPAAQTSAEDAASDKSKLREFERILSQLVETSRETKDEKSLPASSAAPEDVAAVATQPASSSVANSTEPPSAGAAPKTSETPKSDEEEETETEAAAAEAAPEEEELLGMRLMIRNRVDGDYVDRPGNMGSSTKWEVEYSLEDIASHRASKIYGAIQERRRRAMETDAAEQSRQWYSMWSGKLAELSAKGQKIRRRLEASGRKGPVHVVDAEEPLSWEEAFSHHEQWSTNGKGKGQGQGQQGQ